MSTACRHVLVSGRVQGVGFRWSAREQARALGLHGWVRNLPDGRVEVWVEGDENSVSSLLDWLSQGPAGARVTSVEVTVCASGGHTDFEVRRGA